MAAPHLALLFLAALVAAAAADDVIDLTHLSERQRPRCPMQCNFDLCKANGLDELRDKGTRILLRGRSIAQGPFLCNRPNGRRNNLGKAKVGQAVVAPLGSNDFVPISQWRPAGLKRRFSKNYFRLCNIQFFTKQGLCRGKTLRNQEDFVDQLCVVLPVRQYEVLRRNGRVRRVVKTSNPRDCVSFETRAPALLVELTWDSSDDMDLVVEEPGGFVLSRFNQFSPSGGKANNDNNADLCNVAPFGQENTRWLKDSPPPRGVYKVQVEHFNNCGNGPSAFTVRVMVDGEVVVSKKGVSNLDGRAVATTLSFRI